jgi:hypothetical protein
MLKLRITFRNFHGNKKSNFTDSSSEELELAQSALCISEFHIHGFNRLQIENILRKRISSRRGLLHL